MADNIDIEFRDIVREELEDVWEISEQIVNEHYETMPPVIDYDDFANVPQPIIEFNSNIGFMVLFPMAMFHHSLCQCEECNERRE